MKLLKLSIYLILIGFLFSCDDEDNPVPLAAPTVTALESSVEVGIDEQANLIFNVNIPGGFAAASTTTIGAAISGMSIGDVSGSLTVTYIPSSVGTTEISVIIEDQQSPAKTTTATGSVIAKGPPKYEVGFLIANEGNFGSGTGTVSFFDYTTSTVTNDVFQTVNNRPLGNVLQSISIHNSEVFMVVNNAAKVEIANSETFQSTAVIENLAQPRYFLGLDENKAYISQWEDGFGGKLAVVDLNTYTVSNEITTGLGPERMLLNNDQLYVTCSGGFSSDDKVSVINTSTDAVVEDITVGSGPNGIVQDKNGKIWVLCGGKFAPDFTLEVSGSLYRINPADNSVEMSLDFNNFQTRPSNLIIDETGDNIFYTFDGGTFKMGIDDTSLPDTELISSSFYGLGLDPESGYLIGSDAGDFSSNGKIIRYNTADGQKVDEFTVGVIPNGGFHFQKN